MRSWNVTTEQQQSEQQVSLWQRACAHHMIGQVCIQVFNPKDLEGLRNRLEQRKADGTLKDLEDL